MSTPPPPPPPPPPGGPGPYGQPYGQPGTQPPYGQPGYGQPGFPGAPYGQPAYGQPYAPYGQPPATNPLEGRGRTVLWLGILSLVLSVLCGLGLVLGPVAWIMGSGVRRDATQAGWPEPSENRGGRICGIIATAFLVLGVLFVALIVVALRNDSSLQ